LLFEEIDSGIAALLLIRINEALPGSFLDDRVLIEPPRDRTAVAGGGSAGAVTYIKECIDLVERNGGQGHLVELQCDLAEVRKRIEHPSRKEHFKVVTQQELDEFLQKDYFKGLPDKKSLVINNTHLTPVECANKIVESLNLEKIV
jgi:hypothetical protein